MISQIRMQAPAKINIHLAVHERREDGFHDLTSIFQKIDLSDTIDISIEPSDRFSCTIEDGSDIPKEKNTMYIACRKFCDAIKRELVIKILCDKQIPMTTGLGGGSSDAATVLLCLQQLLDHPLTDRQLFSIGVEVGSDVPFFLGRAASLVTGRGEYIRGIPARGDLSGVIVLPEFGISTPAAFSRLDEYRAGGEQQEEALAEEELERMYLQPVDTWKFFNSFTPILFAEHPEYHKIEMLLRRCGFDSIMISGSGSSMVGLSESVIVSEKTLKDMYELPDIKVIPIKVLAD